LPRRSLVIALLLLVHAGCTTSDTDALRLSDTLESGAQLGMQCRSSIAAKPEYRVLAVHLPLADVEQASLTQMIDRSLADQEEVSALVAWQRDVRGCGDQLIDLARRTIPAYVPIVIAAWNKDDEVFVLLARRKIAWGDAVLRLKANRSELLTKVTDQLSRMTTELNQRKQMELNRRASYFDSLLSVVP
jgi:hypothetical protein